MRCHSKRKKKNILKYNKKEAEQTAEAIFIRAQKVVMFTVTFVLYINHLLVCAFRFVFTWLSMMRPMTSIVSHAGSTSTVAYLLICVGRDAVLLIVRLHRPQRSA